MGKKTKTPPPQVSLEQLQQLAASGGSIPLGTPWDGPGSPSEADGRPTPGTPGSIPTDAAGERSRVNDGSWDGVPARQFPLSLQSLPTTTPPVDQKGSSAGGSSVSVSNSNANTGSQDGGNAAPEPDWRSPAADAGGIAASGVRTRAESWAAASNRWVREERRVETDSYRKVFREKCLALGMSRNEARKRSWEATIAAFPPEGVEPVEMHPPEPPPAEPTPEPIVESEPEPPPELPIPTQVLVPEEITRTLPVSDHPQGLSSIPPGWGVLPPNSSLAEEVSWVQANRLLVTDLQPGGGVQVHLERALSPAPSHSALGWLETAISFPGKFADVSIKVAQSQQDEPDVVRRERIAIEEVRRLLAEMLDVEPSAG